MKIEDIKTIGVVGCGSMGSGIIQVAAQAGYQVRVVDTTDAAWGRADKTIRTSLDRMLKKEKITEQEMKDTLDRISFSTDVNTLTAVQYIIEASDYPRDDRPGS